MLVQLNRLKMFWDRFAPLIVFLAVALAFVILAPRIGFAASVDEEVTPVGPDATVETDLFKLTPFAVTLVSSVAIPWLVAFFTNQNIAAWFKKLLLAFLAAVDGVIQVSITPDGGALVSESTVKAAFLTFLGSIGIYVGWVRNTEAEAKANAMGPNIGPAKAA
jgi:hypothetical protein